jgi:hypothetical protein
MKAIDRKKAILLAASLVLCLSALEIGSYLILKYSVEYHDFNVDRSRRYLHIFTNNSDILPYGIKRNYDQEFITREIQTSVHINNVGLREDTDYFDEQIDIAFVGDSFTFGQGVNSGERYSDVLKTYFPDKTILSLSYRNGYATPHYYLFLKNNPNFIPRILIVGLFPKNDLGDDIVETDLRYDQNGELISAKSSVRMASEEGYIIDKRRGRNVEEKKAKFMRNLLSYTHFGKVILVLYGRVKGNIIDVGKKSSELKPIHKGELDETSLTALRFVKELQSKLREYGTRTIVFIIPENFLMGKYPKMALYNEDLCAELREHQYMQASLREWFDTNGIEYIDPTERFQQLESEGTKLYYKYDGHWNREGHAAAAQLIFEYISQTDSY